MDKESESTGSDFFKIPEGKTRLRVLTDFTKVQTVWEGEYPNSKPLGHLQEGQVIKDGQSVKTSGWIWAYISEVNGKEVNDLKIVQMGISIIGQIAKLKQDEEYSFEDMPMPFDITINNTGEGANRYSITPARKNTEVSAEVLADLEEATPLAEIIEKIQAKGNETPVEYPESDDDKKVPF